MVLGLLAMSQIDTAGGRGRGGPGGCREEGKERNLGKALKPASLMPKQKEPRELRLRGPCLRAMIGPRPHSKPVKLGLQIALACLHCLPCS